MGISLEYRSALEWLLEAEFLERTYEGGGGRGDPSKYRLNAQRIGYEKRSQYKRTPSSLQKNQARKESKN